MRGFLVSGLELVRCSRDGKELALSAPTDAKTVLDGEVRCASCGHRYHIREGILDLLGEDAPEDEDSRHELELREGEHQLLRGAPGTEPSWRDKAEVTSTLQRIGDINGLTMLELGCGPGIYTRRLVSARRLIAVDFSLTALRRNRDQLPPDTPAALVRADVGTLRLTPGAFDLALTTLYSNLPTAELRHACNKAVSEALRPEGRYIVSTHHQDQRRVLKGLPESGYYSDGGIFFQCFTERTLRAELNHFKIEEVRPVCVEIPLISRLPNDSLRAWVAQHAASLPGVNQFGSILIASARKPATS